jgi:hypothetical protein
MTIEAAVLELREELNEIAAVEDCAACECLLGIAAQALADLRRLPGDEARDAEDDLRGILAVGRREPHPCLECDPCLPVEPYRRFRQALAAAVEAGAVAPVAASADAATTGEAACGREGCSGCC